MSDLWSGFEHDPRDPAHAPMRAADRDRDVILRALGDAYAEGRLTRDEYDERSERLASARTLGELPVFVTDLLPATALDLSKSPGPAPAEVRQRAVEKYRRERREAVSAFFFASMVCWVIYLASNGGLGDSLPWPVWVMLVTGLNIGRVRLQRGDIIASETSRLTRKAEKARRKELDKKPDSTPNDEP